MAKTGITYIDESNQVIETTKKEEETTTTTKKVEETTKKQTTTTTAAKTTETKQTAQVNSNINSNSIAPAENTNQELLNQYAALAAEYQRVVQEQQNSVYYTTSEGGWLKENGYWVFYNPAGIKLKSQFIDYNNNTYYLDTVGNMSVGWKYINGYWYYFGKNGEMTKGWVQLDTNSWYYLDKDTGKMATSDRYIDDQVYHFNSDGLWIKDIMDYQSSQLSDYVFSLVRFVNNKNKLKKVSVDSDTKKKVKDIIAMLPKDVLSRMVQECKNIYICMNQGEDNNSKAYLSRVSYKDENGDRDEELLPFYTTKTEIYIDGGKNILYLYYGIGSFLCKIMKYQGTYIYNTSVWKTLSKQSSEDLNEFQSLTGTYNMDIYSADESTALACAIGWYLMDPLNLNSANKGIYKYCSQFISITESNPLDVLDAKY